MSLTSRFGLHVLDEGATPDDREAFATVDPVVQDAILAALEAHNHTGGSRLVDPTAAPTYVVRATGGTLPSGAQFGYRYSYVDAFGLETAASPVATVATPASVAAPAAAAVNTAAGGTLTAGLYHYALTTLAGADLTPLGPVALISLDPTEHSVVLTLPAVPSGGDGLVVWRQGPLDSAWTRLGTAVGSSFTDDGSIPSDACPCDPASQPPVANLTRSIASIEVHAPTTFPAGTVRWRIYRSDTDGNFSATSLAEEISPVGDGTLPTGWLDTGGATIDGQPSDVSRTLAPSVVIPTLVVESLPDVTGLQDGTLALLKATPPELHAIVDRAWAQVAGGGGSAGTVVLSSPGGKQFQLEVDDDGVLSTVDVTPPDGGGGGTDGPARNLAATSPAAGELVVTWDAPAGGEPGSYEVLVAGADVSVAAGVHTHHFTGLAPASGQTVTVRALFPDSDVETATLTGVTISGSGGGGTAPTITDTFGRNGELNGSSTETGGKTWQSTPGFWATSAGTHQAVFAGGAPAVEGLIDTTPDGVLQVRILNNNAGVALRAAALGGNAMVLAVNSGVLGVYRRTGGSYNHVGDVTTNGGYVLGHLLSVTMAGDSFTYRDETAGVDLGGTTLAAGDTFPANTLHGIWGGNPGGAVSDFGFTPAS